jgi:citrate lyase beta subunit
VKHLELGASLYVPSLREDLVEVGNRWKYPELRSVIFCTEDSVREEDLGRALDRLASALRRLEPAPILRFVRPRNPGVLREILQMEGVERVDGFVFPKVNGERFSEYWSAMSPESKYLVMVTLETIEVFDPGAMMALRQILLAPGVRDRILSLRIGGNDLFQLLGMRRNRRRTVYESPIGLTISQLVTFFRPHGFNLTAPVYEFLDAPQVLALEVEHDLDHGLFGKTAIHPDQIAVIERGYQVREDEAEVARKILEVSAPAVFRMMGAMCEPATHRAWATMIEARARIYGIAKP